MDLDYAVLDSKEPITAKNVAMRLYVSYIGHINPNIGSYISPFQFLCSQRIGAQTKELWYVQAHIYGWSEDRERKSTRFTIVRLDANKAELDRAIKQAQQLSED